MSPERQKSRLEPARLALSGAGWTAWLAARGRGFAAAVSVWGERRRTRRHMTRLSDHMLKDIGVARADVDRESGKAFWQK